MAASWPPTYRIRAACRARLCRLPKMTRGHEGPWLPLGPGAPGRWHDTTPAPAIRELTGRCRSARAAAATTDTSLDLHRALLFLLGLGSCSARDARRARQSNAGAKRKRPRLCGRGGPAIEDVDDVPGALDADAEHVVERIEQIGEPGQMIIAQPVGDAAIARGERSRRPRPIEQLVDRVLELGRGGEDRLLLAQ